VLKQAYANAMNMYAKVEVRLHAFSTSVLDVPDALTLGKEPTYPLGKKLCG